MTVTFAPGETEFTFPVSTVTDSLDEGVESFRAVLSAPSGAILGSADMATVFINDRKRASNAEVEQKITWTQ